MWMLWQWFNNTKLQNQSVGTVSIKGLVVQCFNKSLLGFYSNSLNTVVDGSTKYVAVVYTGKLNSVLCSLQVFMSHT